MAILLDTTDAPQTVYNYSLVSAVSTSQPIPTRPATTTALSIYPWFRSASTQSKTKSNWSSKTLFLAFTLGDISTRELSKTSCHSECPNYKLAEQAMPLTIKSVSLTRHRSIMREGDSFSLFLCFHLITTLTCYCKSVTLR